jgi:autotransporter-associated beta strand protein
MRNCLISSTNSTLFLNTSNNVDLARPISGLGQLNKRGWGILTLSGSNSFAGSVNTGAGTDATAAGYIHLLNSHGFGSPANVKTVNIVRAEVRLAGGLDVPASITFLTSANRANGAVAFRNVAGTNTLDGNLQIHC